MRSSRKTFSRLLQTPAPALLLLPLLFSHSAAAQGTAPQSIEVIAPGGNIPVNAAPFQVIALASSNLPVTLGVQGPARLNGRLLTVTGTGTIQISATQAGNAVFAPASAQAVLHAVAVQPALGLTAATVPYGTAFNPALLKPLALAAPVVNPAADTATVTSRLDASLLGISGPPVYTPDSKVFRYENGIVKPSGDPHAPGGWDSESVPPPYGLSYKVAFTCDCEQFEAVLQARQADYRIWVDGAYLSANATPEPQAYPERLFVRVQFPDRRPRQIKLYVDGNAPFFGVNTAGGETVSAPEVPLGERVMFFGDSWTGPTISAPALPAVQDGLGGGGYPQLLGDYFNLDYWVDGVGGTGFTNTGTDARGRTFVQRAQTDICPTPFAAVLILGGTNDGPATESAMQTALSSTLAELRACQPGIPVLLYGPQDAHPQLEAAFSAVAAQNPYQAVYTDMAGGSPWFYGYINDPRTGNNYLYENGHPTPLGHDYLAEQIERDVLRRFPWFAPPLYTLFKPAPVAGQVTSSIPTGTLLPVGVTAVPVSFMPGDGASFTGVSGTGTITTTKAGAHVVLSVTNGVIEAVVTPQLGGVPTGTVSFMENGSMLAQLPLRSGAVTLALGQGSHSITASYSGDGNFLPAVSSLPVTQP